MGKNRKILYLTTTFVPCGGTGTLRLVKQLEFLSIMGWEPHVVTTMIRESSNYDSSLNAEARNFAEIHRPGQASTLLGKVPLFYRAVDKLTDRHDFDWVMTTFPDDWDHLVG